MKQTFLTDAAIADSRIAASRRPPAFKLPSAITERMRGPGGLYNLGNLIGLLSGLTLQIAQSENGASAVAGYLAGSIGSLTLTAATLLFFISGEAYHRAWRNGFPPDPAANQLGDLLSGIGALALGASLFSLGHPLLAATAGLLHAAGKFGSAAYRPRGLARANWPWLFRAAVLVSRAPAMLAAVIELSARLAGLTHGASIAPALAPATLVLCYALWSKADLLLFRQ